MLRCCQGACDQEMLDRLAIELMWPSARPVTPGAECASPYPTYFTAQIMSASPDCVQVYVVAVLAWPVKAGVRGQPHPEGVAQAISRR